MTEDEYSYGMSRSFAELTKEVVELPPDQRLMLARVLLQTTEEISASPLSEVEMVWEEEIASRIKALDAGEASGRPWADVMADIDKRFAWPS